MILQEILEKFQDVKIENVYLYFITRALKKDVRSKSSKVLDKFDFKVYQIDVDDEVREHLHSLTIEQLNYIISKKIGLHEYSVMRDGDEEIFTYQMVNKASSFSDVVHNQLKSKVPKILSLVEIIEQEELWAYCVGFYNNGNEENKWIYTFRKILSSKVAINEKDANKLSFTQKILRTVFNVKAQKLELIEGETVNLDKQVDCIYYGDIFYIAKVAQFEKIVGLEIEFKIQAIDVVAQLKTTNMIEGLEIIIQQIEKDPSIHKKLVRLSKIGNYSTLNTKAIKKMEKVAKELGFKVKVKDGKLFIEDEDDIDLILKMLSDYYKEGKVSGKSYGTFLGKMLPVAG